jgi:uncharacterized protein (UPF0276 family)
VGELREPRLDADRYLAAFDRDCVEEMHLAGFTRAGDLLVDTHGAPVDEDVWSLYRKALARFGPKPTIVEWDVDLPSLEVLLGEAARVAEGA